MAELRTSIHASLVRPILLGGAERGPVSMNVLVIFALVLGIGPQPATLMLAALLGTVGHSALVLAARFDPQVGAIYGRHLRYQAFYPAQARWQARTLFIHDFREGVR